MTDEWVLVSSGRTKRPWLGHTESPDSEEAKPYDPQCYLCPSNLRASGATNPAYESTTAFTNDFPALSPTVKPSRHLDGLLASETLAGTCRVVCYSPRHDLRLSHMEEKDIVRVVEMWQAETAELGKTYRWVQVFENNGAAMGASNPHPHGQIWAGTALPTLPAREDKTQKSYFQKRGTLLLLDYLVQEHSSNRVVIANEHWIALVPYWATWPFETMLVPRTPTRRITEVNGTRLVSLAAVVKELLTLYDNLFEHPFPYSMGWHGAPHDDTPSSHWQLHAHFYPPLLRSATVRKFMVGYELLAEAQRDLDPEEAAARLREASAQHYTSRIKR